MTLKISYCYLALILSFILGTHNGYIALWKEGAQKPVQVFPYAVQSLPPADQARLNQGIPIGSYEQLRMLIEDYLS